MNNATGVRKHRFQSLWSEQAQRLQAVSSRVVIEAVTLLRHGGRL